MTKTKRKCCGKSTLEKDVDMAKKEIKVIGKKIASKCKQVKKKFDSLEPEKKKKILAGVIGVAALAAGVGAGMVANSKRKKK